LVFVHSPRAPRPSRPHHQQAPAGLTSWLASVDAASEPAVRLVEIDGVTCVIKRRRPSFARGVSYAVRYVRAAMLGAGCKLVLGEWPAPGVLVHNGLAHEAARLRMLDQANWRVPLVWSFKPGELVLEYVGDDMPGVLRRASPEQQQVMVDAMAVELAAFHAQALWHGGAQVRNLTWYRGEIWRIDFEENIGAALSLPLAQAYDVYQCLSSLVALRGLSEATAQSLGARFLQGYLDANDDAAVRAGLTRMAQSICAASRVIRPVLGWVPGRDVQGFFRVADTLRLL